MALKNTVLAADKNEIVYNSRWKLFRGNKRVLLYRSLA